MRIPVSMTDETPTLTPLELLPHEVVWQIIDCAPEIVLTLRQTSHMLKQCADEYAMMRPPTCELVRELRICGSSDRIKKSNPSSRVYLSIYVHKKNAREFMMRLFAASYYNLISQVEVGSCKNMKVFRLNCYIRDSNHPMLEYIGVCMGENIAKVSLTKCSDGATLSAIAKMLDGIRIKQMKIAFSTLTDDVFTHLMKTITVDKLTLEVKKVVSSDPVRLLLSLSSLTPFIHVKQYYVDGIDESSAYFFGAHNVDWAPIIVEIFACNTIDNKLCIDNFSYPEYLSRESADFIKENLPNLGKRLWFEASCDQYAEGFKYTMNDHWVQAESRDVIDRFLAVKHIARRGEKF